MWLLLGLILPPVLRVYYHYYHHHHHHQRVCFLGALQGIFLSLLGALLLTGT